MLGQGALEVVMKKNALVGGAAMLPVRAFGSPKVRLWAWHEGASKGWGRWVLLCSFRPPTS